MKQVTNFRLSAEARSIVSILKLDMQTSGTEVVEKALRLYYAKKMAPTKTKPLLKFAGKLSNNDAKKMISSIHQDRRNKKPGIRL